jgi:hypothetical protein
MAFTNDPTTVIGRIRLYAGESDADTHQLSDEQITALYTDAGGEIKLAAYFAVISKIALLSANPTSQSWSTYSQSMDLGSLDKLAARLKADCEEAGIDVNGDSVAQFGRAEVARTRRTFAQVEANKAARGETW